ncbi:MAG: hypothetical protein HQ483_03105, partial [Rhodospirillales bacterium]|nr:hypothetical protein [Rhodospirillales bacterium]
MAVEEKSTSVTAGGSFLEPAGNSTPALQSPDAFEVPNWAIQATFSQVGDDLILIGAQGEKITLEGFFAQIPVPSLITFTGQQISAQDIALRIETGGEVQVAQDAGVQVPGQAVGPGDPLTEPLVGDAGQGEVPLSSLESLLISISGALPIDEGMLAVFQAALNEAVSQGVSPEQALAQQQAFVDALLSEIAQGASPQDALSNAKSVFQVPTGTDPPPTGTAEGNILAALASGEGVDAAVSDLIQQNQNGAPLTPEQLAAATDAFIEGLQQGLANGELPADVFDGATQAADGAAAAAAPAGNATDGDTLLLALASGEDLDGVLPAGDGAGAQGFSDTLISALETGQPVGDALDQANQQQADLVSAIDQQDAPGLADPMLSAMATGDGVDAAVGDSADFQNALMDAMQNGGSIQDARQQAVVAQNAVETAQQQSNDPASVDPLLAALSSGNGVNEVVGNSANFAEALGDALQIGGNVA